MGDVFRIGIVPVANKVEDVEWLRRSIREESQPGESQYQRARSAKQSCVPESGGISIPALPPPTGCESARPRCRRWPIPTPTEPAELCKLSKASSCSFARSMTCRRGSKAPRGRPMAIRGWRRGARYRGRPPGEGSVSFPSDRIWSYDAWASIVSARRREPAAILHVPGERAWHHPCMPCAGSCTSRRHSERETIWKMAL